MIEKKIQDPVIPETEQAGEVIGNPQCSILYKKKGGVVTPPGAQHAGLLSGYFSAIISDKWIPDKFGLLAKFSGMTEEFYG